MRLTTAMLADAAQEKGGKLFVLGGGFDTISAPSFPVTHRSLAVAMVAEIEPDEMYRELEIGINLLDEDGHDLGVRAKGKLLVSPPELPPGSTSTVPLVSSFYNVRFPEPKGYAFVITFEDTELARVRFRVKAID